MQISTRIITEKNELNSIARQWNTLAGDNPFLRWEWLGSWWESFGLNDADRRLYVVVVEQDGKIIGMAPWFIENRGRCSMTISFLGSEKTCSDHMTLLCQPEHVKTVADATAKFLTDSAIEKPSDVKYWDHLELIGSDQDDPAITRLAHSMQDAGYLVDLRPGLSCFQIQLPATWDEYRKRRSKSGKRECSQIQKAMDQGKVTFYVPQTINELETAWFTLVKLHQARRESLGDAGCFDHPNFASFLWKASCRLQRAGLLQVTFAYCEGRPVAAQYSLKTDRTFFYYQSGMIADNKLKPGQAILQKTIQDSIKSGRVCYDMLRGDESYKLRWRAEEQPTIEVRIAADRMSSNLQHKIWQAGSDFAGWAKGTFFQPENS